MRATGSVLGDLPAHLLSSGSKSLACQIFLGRRNLLDLLSLCPPPNRRQRQERAGRPALSSSTLIPPPEAPACIAAQSIRPPSPTPPQPLLHPSECARPDPTGARSQLEATRALLTGQWHPTSTPFQQRPSTSLCERSPEYPSPCFDLLALLPAAFALLPPLSPVIRVPRHPRGWA